MSVHSTAGGHIGVHGPCYNQRPNWCLWSVLPPGDKAGVCGSYSHQRTRGHLWIMLPSVAMLMYVVCAPAGGYVDVRALYGYPRETMLKCVVCGMPLECR